MKNHRISQPINLHGRNALVTGASRGIGSATALALAREGANVAVADIMSTQDTAREIEALGRRAKSIEADVSDPVAVKRMVTHAIDALGHIDILVNNAGVVHRDTLLETTEATWDRVTDNIMK